MRKQAPETIEAWIDQFEPDFEEAAKKLCRMILKEKTTDEDLATLAEYTLECLEDDDPRAMGWVGNDGLP
jgi:hypothetical protein